MKLKIFMDFCKKYQLLNTFGKIWGPSKEINNKNELLKAHEKLVELTEFLPKNVKFSYRFFIVELMIHGLQPCDVFCPVCGDLKKKSKKESRLEIICGNRDKKHTDYLRDVKTKTLKKTLKNIKRTWKKEQHQKFKKTCLSKFGAESPLASKKIKNKIKKTNLKKYGVENPLQNIEIKKKAIATNLLKYGSENPMQNKKVKEKVEATNFLKYGGIRPMCSKKIQEKHSDTMLSKYGVSNPMQVSKFKEKMRSSIEPTTFQKKLKFLTKEFIESKFINKNNNFEVNKMQEYFGYKTNTRPYQIIKSFDIKYKKRKGTSMPENEIIEYIRSLDPNIKIIRNTRKIISPKELDIYLPDYNLAIEYNGLMFHSQGYSNFNMFHTPDYDRNNLLSKTEACEKNGIQLLHIFENEWHTPNKKIIWQSVIKNKLRKNSRKFMARKCILKEITSTRENHLVVSLFEENHLQGSKAIGGIRFGLFYEGELVSAMTFGKSRFHHQSSKKDEHGIPYELIRFANKKDTTVMGAASKLLKAFERTYKPKILISYANRRWSDGGLYNKLGFELQHAAGVNYFYFVPGSFKLMSRNVFQKHKLKNKLEDFDPELTEQENMFNNGYRRIFDSGNWVFEKKYDFR